MNHGQALPTNNINGMRWLEPPTIPQYILNKRTELMNNDRQVVTRFTDQMIGKQQSGVDTATESLALQNSGNAMIEHKKGLLQETLGEVFEYCLELALMNWNTTMMFRITGENGENLFEEFNPDMLNNVPVMIESDTDFRNRYQEEWEKRNPTGDFFKDEKPENYKYMQVDNETRKIQYDLTISVGAGLPNNKAYRFQLILQMLQMGVVSRKEVRDYLIKELGLNIPEFPETIQEQQEIGIIDEKKQAQMQQQNGNIEGLTANGYPSLNAVKEGVL